MEKVEIKHFKVLQLPISCEPNSIYYVLDSIKNRVKTFITDSSGIPIPLIDLTGMGIVQSVTGTAVTGTINNPEVNITNFISSELGNLVNLSSQDGKLKVNKITSPDISLEIVSTPSELQIEIATSLLEKINNALQPEDITQYTNEDAQDAIGNILVDTNTIDLAYNDDTPAILASVKPNSITNNELSTEVNSTLNLANTAVQPINIQNFFNKLGDDTDDILEGIAKKFTTIAEKNLWNAKQENLVSGTNIKTVNGNSLLGSGDITLITDISSKEDIVNKSSSFTASSTLTYPNTKALVDGLATKQNTLTNPITSSSILTSGRVPYVSASNILSDSSRLLWNNTTSNFEINGTAPIFKIKNNLNSFDQNFSVDAGGALFLKNHQNKTLALFNNPINSTEQPQMAIGQVTSIPVESQLYVYGGQNGANIDARGSTTVDEANIDLEGNDWETDPKSLGFSYFGANRPGTVLGYTRSNMGQIRFGGNTNSLITSSNTTPIRFGINSSEIANIGVNGWSYQSNFASANTSNNRWIVDKEYVDTGLANKQNTIAGTANVIPKFGSDGLVSSSLSDDGDNVSMSGANKKIFVTNAGGANYGLNLESTTANLFEAIAIKGGPDLTSGQMALIGQRDNGEFFFFNQADAPISFNTNGVQRIQVNTVGLDVTGKATVSVAPTNPTDVVRKTELDLKANLAGTQTFTGIHNFPTATAGTNTTQVATTAFVGGAITTADAGNVKLTGAQTITGQKTHTDFIQANVSSNNPSFWGINSGTGNVFQGSAQAGGNCFQAFANSTNSVGFVASAASGVSTGNLFVGKNVTIDTFTVNKFGNVTLVGGTALNNAVPRSQLLYTNQTVTENKTVTTADFVNNNELILSVDASGGNRTITLDTFTALQGYKVTVKKMDSSANSVIITGVGGVNIDGASTLVVSGQYGKATIGANSTQYIIL